MSKLAFSRRATEGSLDGHMVVQANLDELLALINAAFVLTAKGDLLTRNNSAEARLPVGADGFVLTADAAQALGIKWAAAPPPGAHKLTHEPGGVDALTLLDNSSIKAAAGIIYSKLSLGNSIVNADVAAAAAIAYAKLALTNSVVNADIAAAAAIAYSKLALAGAIKKSDFSTTLADRPVGDVLTYNEVTAPTTISATTEATANAIVTASAFTFNGATPVMIEYWFPSASAIGAWTLKMVLWDDTAAASIGLFGDFTGAAGAASGPLNGRRRLTPANGARTYSIRAFRVTANGTVAAGAGGAAANVPGFIRITRA